MAGFLSKRMNSSAKADGKRLRNVREIIVTAGRNDVKFDATVSRLFGRERKSDLKGIALRSRYFDSF